MKLEEFRREIIEEKYLKEWVSTGIWTWNNDGSVDVYGNVYIPSYSYLYPKLPVKFNKVNGNFDCAVGRLETLENCPEEVTGYFTCTGNLIESVKHSPKIVGENFYCQVCPVEFSKMEIRKICKVTGKIYNKNSE